MRAIFVRTRFRKVAVLAILSAMISTKVHAQGAAELLEKAVYTEETKGDIDAAIQLYEQAIKQGKDAESYAAQALYRLALLQFKKNNAAKATSLLEELITKYPDQTELVAAAKKKLPGELELGPAPWGDGEQMILSFRFPAGLKIGMVSYWAMQGSYENRPAWIVGGRTFAGVNGRSIVYADLQTFRPIHSEWKHALIGEAIADFGDKAIEVKNVTSGSNKTMETSKPIYDNEQVIQMVRRLPLGLGYKTTIDIITTLGGGTLLPLGVEVTKEEQLTVAAGTFKCWKVELSVKQSFWYSADDKRLLVKMEAGGVIGELEEVRYSAPDQMTIYKDDTLGFSVTAPHGWYFFNGGPGGDKDRTRIAILDPDAIAQAALFAFPLQSLSSEARGSVKAWAQERVKESEKQEKNYKVRPDSWKDLTLAGYPAISFMADFNDGTDKKARVHYCLMAFTGGTAVSFFFTTEPANLETFKSQFDSIVGSYVSK